MARGQWAPPKANHRIPRPCAKPPPFQLIPRGVGYGCQAVCVGGPPRRRTRAHPLSCPCPGGVHRRPPMRFRRPPPVALCAQAAEAGKPVYVEKPMALNTEVCAAPARVFPSPMWRCMFHSTTSCRAEHGGAAGPGPCMPDPPPPRPPARPPPDPREAPPPRPPVGPPPNCPPPLPPPSFER